MMMSIQSIWFLVAMILCVVVSLALALGLWLLVWDPANQTHERPSD